MNRTLTITLLMILGIPLCADILLPEVTVTAKREKALSSSVTILKQTDIALMPQSDNQSITHLLAATTPGVVPGAFGQTFIRGNHAGIQYQIDGIQLPDSGSNSYSQSLSLKTVDQLEVITGGIPAEYGQRLAAVVKVTTKSGATSPGGAVELAMGSYNTWLPSLVYGGSDAKFSYFFTANYSQTDRGLDTPQPQSESDQSRGGIQAIHDFSWTRNATAKLDWTLTDDDRVSLFLSDSASRFQIPNYPDSFKSSDAYFQSNFTDPFGNEGGYLYTPSTTDDFQNETSHTLQLAYTHQLDDHSQFQLAPYWKQSSIKFTNDPANDLAAADLNGSTASSFSEDRQITHFGLKGDYATRLPDHRIKVGFQAQTSLTQGPITIITKTGTATTFTDNDPNSGFYGALYAQDDYRLSDVLTLNLGLRYDLSIFTSPDVLSTDSLLSPRLGLSYRMSDTTQVHAFYGKLFQPAPFENLRKAFTSVGGGSLTDYDIKPEKSDYYELGLHQRLSPSQSLGMTVYYKNMVNVIDEAQLLNTALSQPFNLATGYAYGSEISLTQQFNSQWSGFANYSYEIAKGKGLSGGIFTGEQPSDTEQFLDHVQVHTVNAGLTFIQDPWWTALSLRYGSGLRTGPDNNRSLPGHFTSDITVGFSAPAHLKIAVDILNLFDNPYPVTIANGFNGSHYAAGRTFMLRLSQEF